MKRIKWVMALLLAAGMLLGGTAAPAAAAEAPALERIVKDGILRVGMSGDQPPLNMRDRSGKLMGMEVDLAEALAAALDVDLRIVQKPFGELLPALEAGEIDVVLSGVSITPKRAVEATFVGPYVLSGKSILTKSSLLARAREAKDLDESDLKLVVLAGSTSESFARKYLPKAQITAVKNYAEAVDMVRQDKADAMIADMPACFLALLRFPHDGLETLTQPLTVEPIGMAVRANDPQFKNLLENYMTAFDKIGLLDRLYKKWFEDNSWVAALP